ncbi:MAG: DUF3536 domain-containing protein [Chloroflexi bacterium]|nr:DUF3536 domain-containing protein [Chloroflexota bacterium]
MSTQYFCVHGHFYQPARWNPYTGRIDQERGADPFHDFNEKINAECYRPNAEAGNFRHISFDLGPTLAGWLEDSDPRTYSLMLAADRHNVERFGSGNALAQSYNHTILPLATTREKRIQIAWGIADFKYRFQRAPEGMWLAETAVDYETLSIMVEMGIKFTVLAPWQAATSVDTTEPYTVSLPGNRSIAVFFFNDRLSAGMSFDDHFTEDANVFASEMLTPAFNPLKNKVNETQLVLVATDGELYGHHKAWRDRFLSYLLTVSAPNWGYEVISLSRYLQVFQPRQEILIEEDTSWSCHHGVKRWRDACDCTEGSGTWKWHMRLALNRLAESIDRIYMLEASGILREPAAALEEYILVKLGQESRRSFLSRFRMGTNTSSEEARIHQLLEAQYFRQLMFTSCSFFFEDLDRLEPRHNIAYALRAIELVRAAGYADLEQAFLDDLRAARSNRTGKTGDQIYREVREDNKHITRPRVRRKLLPAGLRGGRGIRAWSHRSTNLS